MELELTSWEVQKTLCAPNKLMLAVTTRTINLIFALFLYQTFLPLYQTVNVTKIITLAGGVLETNYTFGKKTRLHRDEVGHWVRPPR